MRSGCGRTVGVVNAAAAATTAAAAAAAISGGGGASDSDRCTGSEFFRNVRVKKCIMSLP